MGTLAITEKPHAVCIPYPAQGHINPMLKLAKILNHRGFHVTFVNTEFNHKRLLKSRGPDSLNGLPTFQFESIPDGLPPTGADATQDVTSLCDSTRKNCLAPFRELLSKLNSSPDTPPVTCIVSDGIMSFTFDAAEELGVPDVMFWTTSACAFLGYLYSHRLVQEGFTPQSYFTNGYLDTVIDWIPGMKNIRLKDLPTFLRTTNPNDIMLDFVLNDTKRAQRASAIILNTFDSLEHEALTSLSSILPPILSIGPLTSLINQIQDPELKSIGSNLWKEDRTCLDWLDKKEPNSVIYVNFGSITVMTPDQLIEFAWGLANSKQTFFWVIRPDLVSGDAAILPEEFVREIKDRSLLTSWCPQEQVLNHPAIGGFLTHNGWNSTIESLTSGVPMVCWPFFAEQPTNCRFCCVEWGVGMEIDSDVKREEIEMIVRELMQGDKGREMKMKGLEWKKLAEDASVGPHGSSHVNLDKMIDRFLLSPRE